MKKVGFIGATDKTSFVIYVAKTLESIGKKVIVVDTTITQKTKYVVPAINPTKSYITDFENIDFAVGFESLGDILEYLRTSEDKMQYDYMLIDIDNYKAIENFGIENTKENYFVTAFDIYSLRKGVEILKNLSEPLNLSRILCDYSIKKEDEEYLDYLSLETKTNWNDLKLYVPLSDFDRQVLEENERVYRVRIKRLSAEYQEGIYYIAQDIVKDLSVGKIRKMIKE